VTSLPWLPPPSGVAHTSAFLAPLQKSPIERKLAPPDLVSDMRVSENVSRLYSLPPEF